MDPRQKSRTAGLLFILAAGCFLWPACAAKPIPQEFFVGETPLTSAPWGTGVSAAAFLAAAQAKKQLFVYIRKPGVKESGYRRAFAAALGKMEPSAQGVTVDLQDPAEKPFVEKYNLDQAPMPLVLAFAPNGAVLGGFPGERITESALTTALASPCLQKCLAATQDKKLVLLCAQNATTAHNNSVLGAVRAFCVDGKYSPNVKVVMMDPADPAERKFAGELKIDPLTKDALTFLLAPPGSLLGTFAGSLKKKDLEAALAKATSGGGCCPGGGASGAACPPAKK
jgi:hypothetical protein